MSKNRRVETTESAEEERKRGLRLGSQYQQVKTDQKKENHEPSRMDTITNKKFVLFEEPACAGEVRGLFSLRKVNA
jgi:hypothetical protein